MQRFLLAAAFIACVLGFGVDDSEVKKHHKKHHHGHHKKHHGHHGKHHHHHHHGHHNVTHVAENNTSNTSAAVPTLKAKSVTVSHIVTGKTVAKNPAGAKHEDSIVEKMKVLEARLQQKKAEKEGHILVNGPVPQSFSSIFAKAVAAAIGTDAKKVRVTQTKPQEGGVVAVTFMASPNVVHKVEQEVTDPDSKLTAGGLHSFLVSKDDHGEEDGESEGHGEEEKEEKAAPQEEDVTPVQEKGIDIDTAMPYGDLEPFGREDTAQELTEDSVKESDDMVDQLERAEVAEEKRAVFRALTRLRGAAITSFDGVARSQTGNIDEYNKVHKWREAHPLHHLADEESDISKWAFPDNADF